MADRRPLQIAIDARVTPQVWGGVAHAAKGLIQGLGQLEDGDERYVIAVSKDEQREWIAPHLGSRHALADERSHRAAVARPSPSAATPWAKRVKDYVKARARSVVTDWDDTSFTWPQVEVSTGFFESLGCDVLHLPTQRFVLCAMPTVFNPHDLQHLHYPQFFDAHEIARREVAYRAGCRTARCVVVGSQWVKDDLVESYGVSPRRIRVIPEGAPTQFVRPQSSDDLAAVSATLGLAHPFIIYPAVAWPHKNHRALLEALRLLRDESGLIIHLVCTGGRYEPFWPEIQRYIRDLELAPQVRFLGFLPEEQLEAVYRLAAAMVQPSLFEASSLPIFEAWRAGIPVACSTATALPEQVVDAGLLFDPHDVRAIADAVRNVVTNQSLRRDLVARGAHRLQDFDWVRTAKGYRAAYRRVAGRPLSEEDRWLLSWESLRDVATPPSHDRDAVASVARQAAS
jgi:glycosyltransferase involved in cell wall biosynthesis